MTFLYTLSIYVYSLIIKCVVPFNQKAKQWVSGREDIFRRIESEIINDDPLIWVHCASLGEFEQGRPLIEYLKANHPKYKILLTFFSPSGYEIRKNYEQVDHVFYLPADTPSNARRFVELVKPEKVFFVKYEFWYHYTKQLKHNDIPLYLVSAIFRDNQLFFKKGVVASWYRKVLFNFAHFFVQDEHSAKLLEQVGVKNCTKAGDTRFDRVAEIAAKGKKLPMIEAFKGDDKLMVAGSSWRPDEELIIQYINENNNGKYIFAPHEIKESNIKRILESVDKPTIRLSEANLKDINNYSVLLIDSIGLLSSVYRYADMAYIGGGFGVGIHNTLEAAIFNIPIVFGPNYKKFNEAVRLIEIGVAKTISNYPDLKDVFNKFLFDDDLRAQLSNSCRNYIQDNLGATEIIISKVVNNS